MSSKGNFYRRDPQAALAGMVSLTLEEKAVYNVVIDLLYSTWRPLEDNPAFIAGWCGCAVQKLNPILRKLVEKGKLIRFEEGGQAYITNRKFEDERLSVKGEAPAGTRSGRGEVGEKSGRSQTKGGSSPRPVETETPKINGLNPLEKSRADRPETDADASLVSDADASSGGSGDPPVAKSRPKAKVKAKPKAKSKRVPAWERDADFAALWAAATPQMRTRSVGREKLWPIWKAAKAKAGGGKVLAEALKRYVAEDGDVGRSGGPALERWLRDGKWQHWTGAPPPSAPTAAAWPGPREVMDAVRALPDGERLATGYLAKCAWRETPRRAVVSANGFIVEELRKQAGPALSAMDVTVLLERAA